VEVHVSLAGRADLSREIYRQLRRAILDGHLRKGELLPPTRELARSLSVSRNTVTVAYDLLLAEGFVTSRVGAGTFVSDHVPSIPDPSAAARVGAAIQPREIWQSLGLPTAFRLPADYDFRTGLPDASLFPFETWRRLTSEQLRAEAIGKGIYAHPAGHPGLRQAIARHIALARGVLTTLDDVVITSGTQQALDVVARTLLAPGDAIAVEDPGYAPPRSLFRSLGLVVHDVPVDDDGLDVAQLPAETRAVYVTPSHQYPLGMSMSLQRRLALLAWAEDHNAAVIEDDYDSEFRYGGRPLEPLQTLDTTGRVIYVGSFSKTMLPTLRLGFIISPMALRDAVYRAKYVTDWHTAIPSQAALAQFIDEGAFARHIRRMRSVYERRHNLIREILLRDFGGEFEAIPSAAGLHITALARGDVGTRINEGLRRASSLGVEVHDIAHIGSGRTGRQGLMLGYGAIPTDRVSEGMRRLRASFSR
jgi:GntR family transcriptional regulator/MocR family aminotransferase